MIRGCWFGALIVCACCWCRMFVSSCLFHYVCADYCSFRLFMLIIVVFVIVALKNVCFIVALKNEKKWLKKWTYLRWPSQVLSTANESTCVGTWKYLRFLRVLLTLWFNDFSWPLYALFIIRVDSVITYL